MSKSYLSSNFVNGQSCSYAKLKTYANCARAEKRPDVAAAVPVKATPAVAAPVAAPAKAPEKYEMPMEGYEMEPTMEGYLDPSPYNLPADANSGEKNYTPSYRVPNFPPITANTLISEEYSCGGYKKILGAYGGMSGSSCTTNYINN